MALIQQLQQTEGDLQAGAQQVTYIREWLAAQQPHLDASITQAVQTFLAARDTKAARAELVVNEQQGSEIDTGLATQQVYDIIQHQIQYQRQEQKNEEGYVSRDAGLVLLWPYLKTLFTNVKIIEDIPEKGMQFVDDSSKMKAHALLITLLGEEPTTDIWVVANALVGLPLETLVTEPVVITQDEIKQCEKVLTAAITHWKGLKNISINSFRALFLALQRLTKRCKVCE